MTPELEVAWNGASWREAGLPPERPEPVVVDDLPTMWQSENKPKRRRSLLTVEERKQRNRERVRQWQLANPDKVNAYQRKRRRRLREQRQFTRLVDPRSVLCLSILRTAGRLTRRELQDRLGLSMDSTRRLLERLQAKGLVRREGNLYAVVREIEKS